MADSSAIQLQSVLFSAVAVEVSFVEERHITDQGVRVQTFQINPRGFEQQIQDVIDAVAELIERYEIAERNPPPTVPSRRVGVAHGED